MSTTFTDREMARFRAENQEQGRKPRILVLGWARHGKDTVAEILRDNHGFSFMSSSYILADVACRPWLAERGVTYDTLEECYEDRVNHRAAWYDAISAFNADDPARLAKMILAKYDLYVGMRSDREYQVAKDLFDHVIWIDASERGLPPEDRSSMDIDFDPEVMILVDNNGTLEDLELAVGHLVRSLS